MSKRTSASRQHRNNSIRLDKDQSAPCGRTITATTSVTSIRYDSVLAGGGACACVAPMTPAATTAGASTSTTATKQRKPGQRYRVSFTAQTPGGLSPGTTGTPSLQDHVYLPIIVVGY